MNRRKQLISILVLIILLILSLTITYALYKSNDNGQAKVSVASPKIRIVNTKTHVEKLDLNTYKNEFKVVNYDEEDNISEVGMDYTLSFSISDEDAPIDIRLFKIESDGSEREIKLNKNKNTVESFNFKAKTKDEDKYRVEIMFNLVTGHMDENVDLNINLNSIQVRPLKIN